MIPLCHSDNCLNLGSVLKKMKMMLIKICCGEQQLDKVEIDFFLSLAFR